jgi:hypothetical protein
MFTLVWSDPGDFGSFHAMPPITELLAPFGELVDHAVSLLNCSSVFILVTYVLILVGRFNIFTSVGILIEALLLFPPMCSELISAGLGEEIIIPT